MTFSHKPLRLSGFLLRHCPTGWGANYPNNSSITSTEEYGEHGKVFRIESLAATRGGGSSITSTTKYTKHTKSYPNRIPRGMPRAGGSVLKWARGAGRTGRPRSVTRRLWRGETLTQSAETGARREGARGGTQRRQERKGACHRFARLSDSRPSSTYHPIGGRVSLRWAGTLRLGKVRGSNAFLQRKRERGASVLVSGLG